MKLRGLLFATLFVISGTPSVFSQHTVNDFLLTAFESGNLSTYQSQINFLRPGNYRIPIVDELELRMSNDEQTLDDVRYQVRVRPSNPWKIRRNNALFVATKAQLSFRETLQVKENLLDRYELAIEYFELFKSLTITQKRYELARKKTEIFQQNMESDLFNARDFADSKLNQIEELEQLDEQLVELNASQSMIELLLNSTGLNWEDFDLISIERISETAQKIALQTYSSAELDYINARLEVAKQEVRVEKADFDFGFVQAEYAPFRNNDNAEVGFSLGINIPIFKNNKPQIAERTLDAIDLSNELTAERASDSLQRVIEYEYLLRLIDHHAQVEQQVQDLNLAELKNSLARSENYDPITILELEEGALKLDEILHRSKFRILEQYLDFLFAYDMLQQQPAKNYLSQELIELQ